MKKILFILCAGIVCFAISCSTKKEGGMSDTAKKNLDGFHSVNKAFETKDFSKIGDFIAEDIVDHTPEGDVKGLANIKAEFEKWASWSSNDKGEVIKEFADDEYVIALMRYTGTYNKDEMGHKAGPYDMKAVEVVRCKDGKGVEHWSYMEAAELMKMMGGMPGMDTSMKTDTTHK